MPCGWESDDMSDVTLVKWSFVTDLTIYRLSGLREMMNTMPVACGMLSFICLCAHACTFLQRSKNSQFLVNT